MTDRPKDIVPHIAQHYTDSFRDKDPNTQQRIADALTATGLIATNIVNRRDMSTYNRPTQLEVLFERVFSSEGTTYLAEILDRAEATDQERELIGLYLSAISTKETLSPLEEESVRFIFKQLLDKAYKNLKSEQDEDE